MDIILVSIYMVCFILMTIFFPLTIICIVEKDIKNAIVNFVIFSLVLFGFLFSYLKNEEELKFISNICTDYGYMRAVQYQENWYCVKYGLEPEIMRIEESE